MNSYTRSPSTQPTSAHGFIPNKYNNKLRCISSHKEEIYRHMVRNAIAWGTGLLHDSMTPADDGLEAVKHCRVTSGVASHGTHTVCNECGSTGKSTSATHHHISQHLSNLTGTRVHIVIDSVSVLCSVWINSGPLRST